MNKGHSKSQSASKACANLICEQSSPGGGKVNIRNIFYELKESFLDLIFPSDIYCISCNKPIYNEIYSICEECKDKLHWIRGKTCDVCGKPLEEWYFPNECSDCMQTKHAFTKGFSCVIYDEMERKIIIDLKYNGKSYIAKNIAEIMYHRIKQQDIHIDYIVPVPLHKKKENERGFNQSQLISKYLSKMLGIELKKDALMRTRYTQPQNQLTLSQRKRNLMNAFKVKNTSNLNNKNILLIDDVFTTGNTVDACSKELFTANVSAIYILTYAIGKNSY